MKANNKSNSLKTSLQPKKGNFWSKKIINLTCSTYFTIQKEKKQMMSDYKKEFK